MMKQQNGNALFLILIAVALFAALSYAVTNSGRGGSGIDREQAEIAAAQISNYASLMRTTIQRMKVINGCADEEYFFGATATDGQYDYTNASRPASGECDVFGPDGGGISYQAPERDWLMADCQSTNGCGFRYFYNGNAIPSVGTSAIDTLMVMPDVNKEICVIFNDSMGIDNPSGDPPHETSFGSGGTLAKGTFVAVTGPALGDDATEITGKQDFCVSRDQSGTLHYFVFSVILPR